MAVLEAARCELQERIFERRQLRGELMQDDRGRCGELADAGGCDSGHSEDGGLRACPGSPVDAAIPVDSRNRRTARTNG